MTYSSAPDKPLCWFQILFAGLLASRIASEDWITQVARTLRFMDLTGLVPSSREIYGFQTFSKDQRLPGQDHATTWRDPVTKALVMLDEPYRFVDQPCSLVDRPYPAICAGLTACGSADGNSR